MMKKPHLPGERNHLLLCSALGFLGGCVLYSYLSPGLWFWGLLLSGVLLGVLLVLQGKSLAISLFAVFLAFGLMRTQAAMNLPHPEEGSYSVSGTVCGTPRQDEEGVLRLKLTQISLDGEATAGEAYCKLHPEESESELPELFDGAEISFEGKVYLADEKNGAPHFDFQKWMVKNGYGYGIYSYAAYELHNTKESAQMVDPAARIREALEQRLTSLLGDNASVAMALLFGDKDGLDDEDYEAFQKLGVAHLMSVSGLHIGILASMLLELFQLLHLDRRLRLPILFLFLISYSALCSFTAASLRAAIMFTVIAAGKLFFRARDRLTILSLAALIILMLSPLEASSAGFILSFSAMLGIYGITPWVSELLSRFWKIGKHKTGTSLPVKLYNASCSAAHGFQSLFAMSLGASIATALPSACFFHVLPTYGLLFNLLLVPLIGSLLTPLLLITSVLCWIPYLSSALGIAGNGLTDLVLSLVRSCSKLPYASIKVATPDAFLCAGIVLFLVLLTRLVPGRWKVKLPIAVGCLAASIALSLVYQPAELRLIQIAAGQADCALLLDGEQTIVIDTGDDGTELTDYLLCENRNIDALYLTHPHMDHVGGLAKLFEEDIAIGQIYVPDGMEHILADEEATELLNRAAEKGIPIQALHAGEELAYSNARIHVLWPYEGKVRGNTDANEASLVLYIELGEYGFLSMGDLSGSYEGYVAAAANLLKVAHHGSATGSYEDFLTAVSPEYALITCSDTSRYLPSDQTLDRLTAQSIPYLCTDETGDIELSYRDGHLLITPYKKGTLP